VRHRALNPGVGRLLLNNAVLNHVLLGFDTNAQTSYLNPITSPSFRSETKTRPLQDRDGISGFALVIGGRVRHG